MGGGLEKENRDSGSKVEVKKGGSGEEKRREEEEEERKMERSWHAPTRCLFALRSAASASSSERFFPFFGTWEND